MSNSDNESTEFGRRFRGRLVMLGLSAEEAIKIASDTLIRDADACSQDGNGKRAYSLIGWAEKIGRLDRSSVSSALRSKGPRLVTLQKLATVAQTSVAWLLGETENPEPRDYSGGAS